MKKKTSAGGTEKKTWQVNIPINGVIYATVEAGSEEEAIDKALGMSFTHDDIAEWEALRAVSEGNVFYGSFCRATAEEE